MADLRHAGRAGRASYHLLKLHGSIGDEMSEALVVGSITHIEPRFYCDRQQWTRLYLAGPMRGDAIRNALKFVLAASELREVGYHVVSPVEMDAKIGIVPAMWNTISRYELDTALQRDVDAMKLCEGVALLDGWELSEGTALEIQFAIRNGIHIAPLDYWLRQRRLCDQ
jgi:hypothetical protein